MPGYSVLFVDKLNRRLFCPICRFPMRGPVQITNCGHRFCDTCLQEFLSAGVFKCPEDDKPLDYAMIYPDHHFQKEIAMSLVRCKQYKEGCKWTGQLQALQAHLDICRYDAVSCPNQCSTLLSRMHVHDHLEFSCPMRRVLCEFCGSEFSGGQMENHVGNCPFEVVWCENKCGARLERRYLSNHMKNECHKRVVPCQFCHREFVEETLQTHQYQCPRYPVQCPNRCDPGKFPREEVELHIQDHCPSVSVDCTFREAGCKYKCSRFSLDKHLEDKMKQHLHLAWELVRKQQLEILELRNSIYVSTQVTNGSFIWRIKDYKSRYIEAVYKGKQEVTSPPFYAFRYGYKLSVSIFPNGHGKGKGKYLSVYLKIIPGEYDNILDWPFLFPLSFTVYDQCSDPEKRKNVVEHFSPDPTCKYFQKPSVDTELLGFGFTKLISHEMLKTRNYLKDDSLFINIAIDTKTFILP